MAPNGAFSMVLHSATCKSSLRVGNLGNCRWGLRGRVFVCLLLGGRPLNALHTARYHLWRVLPTFVARGDQLGCLVAHLLRQGPNG